jgi:hypothetical protein
MPICIKRPTVSAASPLSWTPNGSNLTLQHNSTVIEEFAADDSDEWMLVRSAEKGVYYSGIFLHLFKKY